MFLYYYHHPHHHPLQQRQQRSKSHFCSACCCCCCSMFHVLLSVATASTSTTSLCSSRDAGAGTQAKNNNNNKLQPAVTLPKTGQRQLVSLQRERGREGVREGERELEGDTTTAAKHSRWQSYNRLRLQLHQRHRLCLCPSPGIASSFIHSFVHSFIHASLLLLLEMCRSRLTGLRFWPGSGFILNSCFLAIQRNNKNRTSNRQQAAAAVAHCTSMRVGRI